MVLDMHRDVVADDGASKDSGAPEHAAKQNVVENIKTLLAAARKSGTTVLHIHHRKGKGARPHGGMSRMFRGLREGEGFDAGTRGMEVMPGLEPKDGDLVIEKERASAFAGTETDIVLRAMAIDTLILTGAWTNFSVESTARQAHGHGLPRDRRERRHLVDQRRVAPGGDRLRAHVAVRDRAVRGDRGEL